MSAPHASIGYSIRHELLKRMTAIKINPKSNSGKKYFKLNCRSQFKSQNSLIKTKRIIQITTRFKKLIGKKFKIQLNSKRTNAGIKDNAADIFCLTKIWRYISKSKKSARKTMSSFQKKSWKRLERKKRNAKGATATGPKIRKKSGW